MSNNSMKKLVSAIIIAALLATMLTSCATRTTGGNNSNTTPTGSTSESPRPSYTNSITIYMPVEYVDLGVLRDFEREFGVGVTLVEFDSNEEMYEEAIETNEYDVLVPSDYMIDRLIQEGYLAKLNHDLLPNMSYLSSQYMSPQYDGNNDYQIPYMVGTLGILYNRRTLQISSWQDMFGASGILMVDSERDVVGVALKMLGYSMNSTDNSELEAASQALQRARGNIRGYYESTYIVDMITAQEAFIGVVYSGDGKLAVDLNSSLAYIIPEEGSNKWTDAFVIPANSSNIELAHAFINFMCAPNIAIRNMSAIGYTSPVSDAWSEFAGNKIMFPIDDDLAKCETFTHSPQIVEKQGEVWQNLRNR